MSEHTYKCANAKATANRIWNADFYDGSFNELVESGDSDSVIATVGRGELSGPERKISMVATLLDHPWSQEVAEFLIESAFHSDPPLIEWSIGFKNRSWTITMVWRN